VIGVRQAVEGDSSARALLRHTLATLAYRAEKVLRNVPADFARTKIGPATRTPLQILNLPCEGWDEAMARFFAGLEALDRALTERPEDAAAAKAIFQGPIADALTHVGQLALLRGMAGVPVRPESYARATIRVGVVGLTQAAERVEFDGDASA
jgi:hypothetical protein